jgi:cyanate lyase
MNKDEVWVAALFYGQVSPTLVHVHMRRIYLALKAKANEEELHALEAVLQLGRGLLSQDIGHNWYPNRGIGPIPPTDPLLYRLFEVENSSTMASFLSLTFFKGVLVYGHAIKVS